MAKSKSILCSLYTIFFFLIFADALKFDVEAHSQGDTKGQRCIRNFVAKDTLVIVTAIVDGYKGDGMVLNILVSWTSPVKRANPNVWKFVDQGCSWERVRTTQGCCGRAENGFHISRRCLF
jgi:hypothetical protein